MPATFLLVHGAWHGASHWDALTPLLTAHGHRVVALDLPGHGPRTAVPTGYLEPGQPGLADAPSPVAGVTLEAAADAVVAALHAQEAPVVLVGHSMAGPVVTAAAERAPERVAHLVYVVAFLPTRLPSAGAYLGTAEASTALGAGLYLGDPAVTGAVRINPRSEDPAYLEELRAAYFSGLEPDAFAALVPTLTPDLPVSFVASEVRPTAARWGRIPRTFVHCEDDRAMPPALQDLLVADADALAPATAFSRIRLGGGHAPFATRPAELADALAGITA